MSRFRGSLVLQFDDAAAALRQRGVAPAIFFVELTREPLDPIVPLRARSPLRLGCNRPLETGIRRKCQQVTELEACAKNPEARIHDAKEAERAEANPVR